MDRSLLTTALISVTLIFELAGCGKPTKKTASGDKTKPDAHNHSHDHATKGPHGGSLIELGEEEFHAELVHDDKAGTVTVYILDSAAKASMPIESPISINLKRATGAEQFALEPSPDTSDPAGKSSRFVSSQADLAKALDDKDAEAQLAVSINGKPYRGKIEHHHEHDTKK